MQKSSMTYISADCPIPEIQNPQERSLSIKMALEMGLEVPEYLLMNGIDRNWKSAIHWSDIDIHFDLDHGTIEDGALDHDYAIMSKDLLCKRSFYLCLTQRVHLGVIEYE